MLRIFWSRQAWLNVSLALLLQLSNPLLMLYLLYHFLMFSCSEVWFVHYSISPLLDLRLLMLLIVYASICIVLLCITLQQSNASLDTLRVLFFKDCGFNLVIRSPSLFWLWFSDWAGNAIDCKSTTGFCVRLGPNLVSWSAKKQSTVSRSSTEAEHRALALTASNITWILQLLTELSVCVPSLVSLWCDNMSAIALAQNLVFHARTKHI